MSRRQAREIALQTLFQLDLNPVEDGADVSEARQAAIDVALGEMDDGTKLGNKDMSFLKELVNSIKKMVEAQ